MDSLQPGIPLPSLLTKKWSTIVIDLKDCFFTIPLQEENKKKIAFIVITYNILNLLKDWWPDPL